MSLMNFAPAKDANRRAYLNVLEPIEGKIGYPVWINELNGKKKLPGHRVTMFMQGDIGENMWFELSGPIRKQDSDGNFLFQPRRNSDGQFVDEKGNVVENESQAAQSYVYVTNKSGDIVHGKFGSINLVNSKKDKETGKEIPTKSTYLNVKLYTDSEAYQMARTLFVYKNAEDEDQRDQALEQLNREQKEFGSFNTMFINDGAEYLKGIGFEVRDSGAESSYNK